MRLIYTVYPMLRTVRVIQNIQDINPLTCRTSTYDCPWFAKIFLHGDVMITVYFGVPLTNCEHKCRSAESQSLEVGHNFCGCFKASSPRVTEKAATRSSSLAWLTGLGPTTTTWEIQEQRRSQTFTILQYYGAIVLQCSRDKHCGRCAWHCRSHRARWSTG